MIKYTGDITQIEENMLEGFFVDWPNPPSKAMHLSILSGSYKAIIAIDTETNRVVGFVTAVSDGVIAAYIPLLEVLPVYQNRGIGKELMTRMLEALNHLYMIDLLCDASLQEYYQKFGMMNMTGSCIRNYDRLS